jgi:uncharacterized repeat protein (TIGR01451 family)
LTTYCARFAGFGTSLLRSLFLLGVLLASMMAMAPAAELKFKDVEAKDLTAVTSGSAKRALFKNAGTVGGKNVDLVAKASTGTSANDFSVHKDLKKPGVASIVGKGSAAIWADWYIYETGTYNLATDKGGVPVEAEVFVQYNDLDGPNQERLFIELCAPPVEFVRISRQSTLPREFGTVAGVDSVFSAIGDKPYTGEATSGAEVSYSKTSVFRMGRIGVNQLTVALDDHSYKESQSFDLKCSDMRKPAAKDDRKEAESGTPVTLHILENDGNELAGGAFSVSSVTSFAKGTVSLVLPSDASSPVTIKRGEALGDAITGFTVKGQGTWTYDDHTGGLTFNPEAGFRGSPTPVEYTFKNGLYDKRKPATTANGESGKASVTILYPDIQLVKTATLPAVFAVGALINYKFKVSNPGAFPLTNVQITDTMPGVVIKGEPITLAAGSRDKPTVDETTFTATYALTDADLKKAGGTQIINTASASGSTPDGKTLASLPSSAAVALPNLPGLTIKKTAGAPAGSKVGDTITYAFEVANTGNVTLTGVKIVDEKLGNLPAFMIGNLAAGVKTVTAVYKLTEADVAAGKVENTATVTGTPPPGSPPLPEPQPSTVTIGIPSPGLTVKKTAGVPTGNRLGDTITYTFKVKNTGNVTLKDVVLDEPGLKIEGQLLDLSPGAEDAASFTAVHEITQADLDKGRVDGAVIATGTSPDKTKVVSDPSATTVALASKPEMAIDKKADRTSFAKVGDKITYIFTITNIGNVTLRNLVVSDKLLSTLPICQVQQLAPAAVTSCSADHVIKQAHLDAGAVRNVATLTGDGPDGTPLMPIDSAPVTTVADVVSKLTVEKTADAPAVVQAGNTIKYTFVVRNEGNVTLSNVTVQDTLPGVVLKGGPIAALAPGEANSTSFSATYVLTQKDVDAGKVVNKATATGTHSRRPVAGEGLIIFGEQPIKSPEVTVPVALAAGPELTILKRAGAPSGNTPGATIAYDFVITNTGNVTLSDVTVTDALPGVLLKGQPIKSLAPGEVNTTAYQAVYTLKQSDIDAGSVENTAIVKANPPTGVPITAISPKVSTPIVAAAKLDLLKSIGKPSGRTAGASVPYTFKVSNSGNVTLVNITITDILPGIVIKGGPIPVLAPGQTDTTTFTATYILTQADIIAKRVLNKAKAHGRVPAKAPPKTAMFVRKDVPMIARTVGTPGELNGAPMPLRAPGDEVSSGGGEGGAAPIDSGESAALLEIGEENPELDLVKTGRFNDENGDGHANADETITYRFVVGNKGTATIHDVSVVDEGPVFNGRPAQNKLSRREPVAASIEPGKNQTFTATYRLGQDDIDAAASLEGGVRNKATAQGYNGDGATSTLFHSPESSSVIDLPAADGKDVSITKQAGLRQIHRGEKAPFTIKVANNSLGNVGAISVTDVLPSGFRYVEGSATVNGVAAIPVILGRNVRFDNLRLGPKADLTIRLQMLALSTAEPGKHTNRARLDEAGGGQLAPEASATIEIIIDPVFDCGDIAGKVFDDVNNNGYADPDEPGLPGVRVATVKGLLVTTDKHGRFHVACADLPDKRIGSNFIMKLDPRTLPTGYSVTTENPRVIRLTAGKMSKLNFGASIGHVVRLDLTDGAFEDGTTVLKMEWSDSLDGLVEVLKAQPSTLRIFYLVTVARKLAEERLAEIGEDIGKRWKAAGGTYELNIETRTEADQ